MTEPISRRDWIKTVGVVGAGAIVASDAVLAETPGTVTPATPPAPAGPPGEIVELISTSEIFVPARGRSYQKFSFDFPEPSVVFGDYRFGFLVFTDENTYGLDRSALRAEGNARSMRITCDGSCGPAGRRMRPAGSSRRSPDRLDDRVEHDVEMERPIKTVTTIVRGVPRGAGVVGRRRVPRQPDDSEMLVGYPFGARRSHGPGVGGAWRRRSS